MNEKLPKQPSDDLSANQKTLQSYELGIREYVDRTVSEVSGETKTWIDATLSFLPLTARIIEIGSAFGRDAQYMESFGYTVERTDATQGFVSLLQENGYSASRFNVLTDDFTSTYDLIFANAVFLHFKPQQLRMVLEKCHASLSENGVLSFSVKHGKGEEWTTAKVDNPRYFCYWQADTIKELVESTKFDRISISEGNKFLSIITHRTKS